MRVACVLILNLDPQFKLLEFAEACLRFSPQIAIREPGILFIEIGKCRSLYSEASFIARLQVLLRRFGVEAKVMIADDLPSSLAMARYQVSSVEKLPIEALEDFGDPFGKDPVGRKLITKMIESFRRLGVSTLAQFKTIPSSQIPSRFGGLGLYCRQNIEGAAHLPWPYWRPPEQFLERMELLPSEYCSDLEPLLFKAKEVMDRLFSRLKGRFLRAEVIRFSMEVEKYSTIQNPLREWTFELISPQGSTKGFLPILKERLNWDLNRNPIESYVTAMSCQILSTSYSKNSQNNFFHNRDEFDESMGSLFGQLEEYLGKDRVFWARVTENRFPEKSWVKAKGISEVKDPQIDLRGKYPRRPTRIFRSAIPITVIQDRIVFKGRTFKSIQWSKVERLSIDWIDDEAARNYYRVDLEGGRALWIFSDPSHHYFVHGYFE